MVVWQRRSPWAGPVLRGAVVLAVLLVVGLVVYGVVSAPPIGSAGSAGVEGSPGVSVDGEPAPTAPPASTLPSSPVTALPGAPGLPRLPVTADAEEYAAAVAAVLFGMDHRTYTGADYVEFFTAARSPRAVELIPEFTDEAFLAAVGERIPDDYMWQRMRDSDQWASYEPTQVWEPDYIREKRANGELPEGVAGLNVTGTQVIHYLDENGQPTVRERAQWVSLLLACEPVHPACRLVAISTGVVE